MRYIILRTSQGSDIDVSPYEGAYLVDIRHYRCANVPYIESRGGDPRFMQQFYEEVTDIEKLPNGMLRGISRVVHKVWMIDIDDIHAFVDAVDSEIILSVDDYPDYGKMYTIEIYDSYRE